MVKYDKRSALALFVVGAVCGLVALVIAVKDGRGSNTAFLEAAAFFFCAAWIIERLQNRARDRRG
ncbi:hypothetical protein [Streptomyces subrutilus]|uniref:Uncharacterized protein n=1 Tax=Streptomyces subrutilus TaxID=36818 RepID=A0A1E5NZT5_9ACTN|nr:hypothetical protein [Streptomyces subrutilus]OEJ22256.1 hypothetical protein BGK67_32265 [Streptomyces subrutilus]